MSALILSTVLSILSVHSPVIGKQMLKWMNKPSLKEKNLIAQKNNLKLEQSKINMIDSFARYSKIQRRINIIDQDLTKFRTEKNSIILHIGLTHGLKIALGLLLFILSIYYRYTPVFQLSSSLDLMPFNHIISYPNGSNQGVYYNFCSYIHLRDYENLRLLITHVIYFKYN